MPLKDFIKKFNKPAIPVDEEVVNPQNETISTAYIIDIKDLRIKALERQIELLKGKHLKGDNKKKKIKDIVLKVFVEASKELNAGEVFEKMKKTKFKRKKATLASVRSSIQFLRLSNVLEDGKKRGTYSARLKKDS